MACWRPASAGDIDGLLRVADVVHPDLPESGEVFAERVRLFPEGCLILAEGDNIYGYAISHPIRKHQPPPLDRLLGEIAPDADQYYIHDLAIMPELRGRGFAKECLERLLKVADRFPTTCLISVYGTSEFWGRYGFAAEAVDAVLVAKLRDYGDDATFLARQRSH